MNVHSVHTRTLNAAPERVGDLLDGLASEHDQLWPAQRWPTTVIEFDRPLGVGARGGHGLIRYSVESYDPGCSVVFRFDPGTGIEGLHRLDVEAVGPGETRMVHTLDSTLSGPVRLLKRPLLQMHDTLVEDLLDNAERATSGRQVEGTRMPLWMRAMMTVEEQLMPPAPGVRRGRLGRLAGVAAPAVLAGLAALHAAWALGWRWPGGSDSAFAERVVSSGELPPEWATWAVAGLLLSAAGLVRAASAGSPSTVVRAGAFGVAGALVARGVAGLTLSLGGGLATIYQRLDVAVYSPLCLALGAGVLLAVRRMTPPRGAGISGATAAA